MIMCVVILFSVYDVFVVIGIDSILLFIMHFCLLFSPRGSMLGPVGELSCCLFHLPAIHFGIHSHSPEAQSVCFLYCVS